VKYLRAYQFVFDSPNWTTNLLLGTVCQLIPVVGPFVLMGYLFEVVEALHRRGDDGRYPDFAFERFMPYLVRGLYVFLVILVVSLPMILVLIAGGIGMAAVGYLEGGNGPGPVFLTAAVVFAVLAAVGMVFLTLASVPLQLRAGLSQDFNDAFSLQFVRDFVRRVRWELVLSFLFLMATSWVAVLAGMLLCFIGLYPAVTLVSFAQHHLYYQLYELYLARGGEMIPIVLTEVGERGASAPRGRTPPFTGG
jgi:hypothetical protein